MEKIWEFFENLNEYVYVEDLDNNELIYLNRKGRESCGIASPEEYLGKKCQDVLPNYKTFGLNKRKDDLKPGYFRESEDYNPFLDQYLLVKETLVEEGGKQYRLEIALNSGNHQKPNNILEKYQHMETIVNEGFRLALQEPLPDKTIQVTLEYLGKALDGERTYIFEKNVKGGDDNTYEWVDEGITPEIDNLQDLPAKVCDDWYQNFRENKSIVIEDIEKIRFLNPLQYEKLKAQNIHSLVVVPLYDEGKVIGFYGVDNPPVAFFDYAANMLQIMGSFIVSALKRRDLVRELRDMSYRDQLTGLGNRHAMNEYVENWKVAGNIGVVYCDITGLKHTNDTYGHVEGDKLIIRAGECLKRVFNDYGVFRIGGDELLVLCMQIDKEQLEKKAEILRQDMKEHSVIIAIGTVWEKDAREGIDSLLTRAEALMYKDKAAYYKASGLDRRR